MLFVEVETGRSDIAANLAKYHDDNDLVVLFTNDTAARYRDLILLARPSTRCLTTAELHRIT